MPSGRRATAASALGVRVNGALLPSQPVQAGWQRYTWTLPPAVADALGRASAELDLIVDGRRRPGAWPSAPSGSATP